MTRIALYPGSFDPPTRGHEDLIRRAALLADRLVVAVVVNPGKQPMFPAAERAALLAETVADLPNVTIGRFEGLVVEYARTVGATILVRGVRSVGDFDSEQQMAQMNRHLHPGLDTVFLAPAPGLGHISSTLVREIARLGGDVSGLVPPVVGRALAARIGT